jgi:hypothetical protein
MTIVLCVTLESPETVDYIISSATILRTSTDPTVKRVYFNRDLTKQQADAAYQRRLEKRSKKTQPVSAAAAAGLQAPGGHIATTTADENSFQSGSI